MCRFRERSIRQKLVVLITATSALAVFGAGVAALAFQLRAFQLNRISRLSLAADVIAANSSAPLAFNDKDAAAEMLSALQADPSVESACLYDRKGAPFARYVRHGLDAEACPAEPTSRGFVLREGIVDVADQVVLDGEEIGRLYVRGDLSELRVALKKAFALFLLILVGSTGMAFLLATRVQKVVSAPISALAETVAKVSRDKDYALRVVKEGDDELGALIDGFNEMLGQIGARDRALQTAHDELETRVAERTAELRDEIEGRKRTEAELARARDAALESSRSKSQFLANMSHEIRTPMNAIVGMTSLLLDTTLDAEQTEFAQTVQSSSDALLTIINDILDFSKIESGKLDLEVIDFDLRRVVDGVLDLLAERASDKGIELASVIEPDVPTALQGDPGRLRQVLINLVGNGVKFTDGGEVVVTIRREEETERDVVLHCAVSDTGIGISDEAKARLFQSFSQADGSTTRKYGGTGLGLAISKALVDRMSGSIGVSSRPGAGSTFWFKVPLAKQTGVVLKTSEAPPLRGLRVLVVDDNVTNRKILHRQLAGWGAVGAEAPGGEEALRELRRRAAEGTAYDLAILDMQMPGMDGLTLAGEIKRDPAIAATRLVLAMSTIDRDAERERAAGIAAFLSKPLRQSRLLDCLRVVARGESDDRTAPKPPSITAGMRLDRSTRVLVVEDNIVNQRLALFMLRALGVNAEIAANGIEALRAVERYRYDVVMMDCQMPVMDGYEATREIRRREGSSRRTPIIAVTAHALEGERDKCLAAGMDDYLSKPVKREALAAMLDRWAPAEKPAAASAPAFEGVPELSADHGEAASAELIDLFVQDASERMHSIGEAIRQGDAEMLFQAAHSLKGSSGSIGARRVAGLCAKLEHLGRSGTIAGADRCFAELRVELARAFASSSSPEAASCSTRSFDTA
jgi:two-component system, sensor histidine kinase and response regulator